ncbi:hypothetical protein Pcinc_030953 [Petrolisthes cinctipes]|uniref:Caspase family p20 domain-containing protein n=1 Tax=Petrolisthes cinctipes TaxID=88211 RepID=A0AAE1EXM8_PETCI|nr:hypothetical protein Pcinc_030953 [Petrolisthes cinctipes]
MVNVVAARVGKILPPKMKYYLEEDEETYSRPEATRHQGTALIINNLQPGCSQDVQKLADVFSRLGYKIQGPFSNLTRNEVLKKVSHLKELTEESSVIVVYYGKGFEDYLITSDSRAVAYQELFYTLNDNSCPNLAGRPKIFIFNICFYTGTVVEEEESVDDSESELATDSIQYGDVPAEQDMFILTVEVDGNCDEGSLLTEALYRVLQSSDGARELTPLMRTVSRRLQELQAKEYTTETRTLNFWKDFYFTPSRPTVTPPSTPVSPLVSVLQRSHVIPQKFNVVASNKMKTIATEDAYSNRSTPRGLVLVISYDTYMSENLPNCYWRKSDSQILSNILEQCGYEVTLLKNLSMEELGTALKHYKERKQHRNLDSAMVVWLGLAHDTNTMYTSEGQTFPLKQLYTCFTNTNCPALTGKSKFIFLHMTLLEEDLKETQRHTVEEDLKATQRHTVEDDLKETQRHTVEEDLKETQRHTVEEDLKETQRHTVEEDLKETQRHTVEEDLKETQRHTVEEDLKETQRHTVEEDLKETQRHTVEEDLRDTFILRLISRLKVDGNHPVGFLSLCRVLADRAHDSHLEKIVSLAEEELARNPSNKGDLETFTRQYSAFSKNFYLNPKKGHK